MTNGTSNDSRKAQTIKELEERLIDVSGYIGNSGNPNNTEAAKVMAFALIALKLGDTQ